MYLPESFCSSPCFVVVVVVSAGEPTSADSWKVTAVVSEDCGPWGPSEQQSFYYIPIKILLNIFKFQDLNWHFCLLHPILRNQFPLSSGRVYESLLEFSKIIMLRPYPRLLKSKSLGVGPRFGVWLAPAILSLWVSYYFCLTSLTCFLIWPLYFSNTIC